MTTPTVWPEHLKQFIESVDWIYAKTYASTWPHEYLVKEQVNEHMFLALVRHIRANGYIAPFYQNKYKYFRQDDMVYWTMVPDKADPAWYPVQDEDIINRCPYKNTYEYRLKHGSLP